MDAVVQLLVNNVAQALFVESHYALEFATQFQEMTDQVKYLRSFVIDVDKLKEKRETVKQTLVELRELIYEADDLVMDCLIRADHRKIKESSPFYYLSPREILFRYQTGKKLTDINRRITKMRGNLRDFVKPIGEQPSGEDSSSRGKRWTSQVFDQSEIVGLAEDARKIKGWIFPQNEEIHRIGIVGMGGLGKTTLTQKIFNDIQVVARFEKKIWVSVTQTVSEIEIMKSILRQLDVDDSGTVTGNLQAKIFEVLSQRTYLIVMDDVWSIEDGWWDRISCGLPKTEGLSSCIIITSRNEEVVRGMGVEEARIHRPRLLDEEESWSLFCKVAFMSTKGRCKYSQLEEIGKKIVKKCHGLPLAIKTTGGLLNSKRKYSGEWRRICDDFHEKLTAGSNSSVMASLQLSYDELPIRLKNCILCFSIYPEDYEINSEQLVRWWVGEGFVHDESSITATESGFRYLTELISRCLVEVVQRRSYDGRVYICKMHDMVRDLTIKIAREEAFFSLDSGGRQISRRLGVTREMDFQTLDENTKLRALLLTTSRSVWLDRNIGLSKVKSLRVLDLSYIKLEKIDVEDLWRWIVSLKRLAHLSLRDAAGLIELPYSIGKLWGLQILILGECKDLERLPASITTLSRLTVLDVGNCPSLHYLPQGMSRLFNLKELYGFKIGSGPTETEGCQLGELKGLTKLRVLQVDINQESIIEDKEMTVFAELKQLKVLSINANNCEDKNILRKLEMLCPPPCLEEVYLGHYHGESTPGWINPTSLPQLLYLCIDDSRVLNAIKPCFWGSPDNAWKVEGLCLKFLPRLQVEWTVVQEAMPELRYLEVSRCYMLQSFPCNVKALGVWNKPEEEKEEGKSEDIACQEE